MLCGSSSLKLCTLLVTPVFKEDKLGLNQVLIQPQDVQEEAKTTFLV